MANFNKFIQPFEGKEAEAEHKNYNNPYQIL